MYCVIDIIVYIMKSKLWLENKEWALVYIPGKKMEIESNLGTTWTRFLTCILYSFIVLVQSCRMFNASDSVAWYERLGSDP